MVPGILDEDGRLHRMQSRLTNHWFKGFRVVPAKAIQESAKVLDCSDFGSGHSSPECEGGLEWSSKIWDLTMYPAALSTFSLLVIRSSPLSL